MQLHRIVVRAFFATTTKRIWSLNPNVWGWRFGQSHQVLSQVWLIEVEPCLRGATVGGEPNVSRWQPKAAKSSPRRGLHIWLTGPWVLPPLRQGLHRARIQMGECLAWHSSNIVLWQPPHYGLYFAGKWSFSLKLWQRLDEAPEERSHHDNGCVKVYGKVATHGSSSFTRSEGGYVQ
jgi:hypothetical protein